MLNLRRIAIAHRFYSSVSINGIPEAPKIITRQFATDSTVKAANDWDRFPKKVVEQNSHASHWKIERIFSVFTLPLAPAAYFFHGTTMDYVLAAVVVLHMHWGAMSVVTDYARAIVIGEKFAAMAPKLVYLMTALMLAGILHFNYYDVGLTKAFEMVFSL